MMTRDSDRFYASQLRDTICQFVGLLQKDDNMHCHNF